MKVRDILKRLERDGWKIVRIRGSHRQLQHGQKTGLVTLAGPPTDELHPKTLKSILRQAGLDPEK